MMVYGAVFIANANALNEIYIKDKYNISFVEI